MAHRTTEIRRFMAEQGFHLLRAGKHWTWSDGEIQITTSISPSCSYALQKIAKDIRRARAAKRR